MTDHKNRNRNGTPRNGTAAGALLLVSASVALVGCIGVTAQPPKGAGAPIKQCYSDPFPAADGLLDDFEDGNTKLATEGGRSGYWFKAADSGGSFFGPEDMGPVEEERPGSDGQFVLRPLGRTGTGDDQVWGAQVGMGVANQGKGYDASRYTGISFWAKVAEGTTGQLRFEIADVNSHPEGGVCSDCWNHFGKDMNFTTEWQQYTLLFRSLSQQDGWGNPRPANIDPSQLFQINWKIGPGKKFELHLDDVHFVDCK